MIKVSTFGGRGDVINADDRNFSSKKAGWNCMYSENVVDKAHKKMRLSWAEVICAPIPTYISVGVHAYDPYACVYTHVYTYAITYVAAKSYNCS